MPLRPPNPQKITLADLETGDVLLSCGDIATNPLDHLITLVDEGDYSHASLVTVELDPPGKPMVIEATTDGIKYETVDVDMGVQVLVDAYRYVSPDGHTFKDPGWPVTPVIDQAMSVVGANYDYNELFMAAVVLLAADERGGNPDTRALIRLAEMLIVEGLEAWLEKTKAGGKTPMTCVEVITAAYWGALAVPANKYGLEVELVRQGTVAMNANVASSDEMTKWQQLRGRIKSAMEGAAQFRATARAGDPPPGLVTAGSVWLPAGMCTPRDLETSPTLKFVGCLKDTRTSGPPGG